MAKDEDVGFGRKGDGAMRIVSNEDPDGCRHYDREWQRITLGDDGGGSAGGGGRAGNGVVCATDCASRGVKAVGVCGLLVAEGRLRSPGSCLLSCTGPWLGARPASTSVDVRRAP